MWLEQLLASQELHDDNERLHDEVQKLLNRLSGLAIGPALKIGFLKSMMRARGL